MSMVVQTCETNPLDSKSERSQVQGMSVRQACPVPDKPKYMRRVKRETGEGQGGWRERTGKEER